MKTETLIPEAAIERRSGGRRRQGGRAMGVMLTRTLRRNSLLVVMTGWVIVTAVVGGMIIAGRTARAATLQVPSQGWAALLRTTEPHRGLSLKPNYWSVSPQFRATLAGATSAAAVRTLKPNYWSVPPSVQATLAASGAAGAPADLPGPGGSMPPAGALPATGTERWHLPVLVLATMLLLGGLAARWQRRRG